VAKAPITLATPPAMTMVSGFGVQINGFIPIPKDDLKRQIEVPQLLLDIQEGRKTLADLTPHLVAVDFRMQHVGRRVTVDEANAWRNPAKPADQEEEPETENEEDNEAGD
jgi:hypothetical protein